MFSAHKLRHGEVIDSLGPFDTAEAAARSGQTAWAFDHPGEAPPDYCTGTVTLKIYDWEQEMYVGHIEKLHMTEEALLD